MTGAVGPGGERRAPHGAGMLLGLLAGAAAWAAIILVARLAWRALWPS